MPARSLSFDPNQKSALVRAFRSLTFKDAEIVAQLVDAFDGAWAIQTSDDYDGYLFMLIEPSAERTEQLPSFMVSGTTGQIELAVVDGDDHQTLGCFADIDGLTVELAVRLTTR